MLVCIFRESINMKQSYTQEKKRSLSLFLFLGSRLIRHNAVESGLQSLIVGIFCVL